MESPEPQLLEILIDEELLKDVETFVQRSPGECSWFGIGCPKTLYVSRIEVPKQENTSASTEPDDEDMARIIADLEEGEAILWWGHSHSAMGNFFSTTDWETWADLIMGRPDDYPLVATVHNRKGDDTYQIAFVGGYTFPDLAEFPFDTVGLSSENVDQWLKKCSKPSPKTLPLNYNSNGRQTWSYSQQSGGGSYQTSYSWGEDPWGRR